jgi:hypothetical protein
MAKQIAVMLDGGHVRVHAERAGKNFDPEYIEKRPCSLGEPLSGRRSTPIDADFRKAFICVHLR